MIYCRQKLFLDAFDTWNSADNFFAPWNIADDFYSFFNRSKAGDWI